MARINVDDYAFDDPRFDVLAGALRCLRDRWHALGRCLRIWHLCASRRTNTVRPIELAQLLGVRKPLTDGAQKLVTHAFVTVASLGEWQGDVIRVRGTEGRTDYLDRMDNARSLPGRIVEHIRDYGPSKRSQIRHHFEDTPRSTFYRAIKQLLDSGELLDTDDTLSLATDESVPRGSHGTLENVHGQSLDTIPDPVPVLAPAPAPAPPEQRALRAHTPACPESIPESRPTVVPRDSHGTRPGETDRYTELFLAWDTTGREACGDSWRSPGELAGRHRIREALNNPELVGRSDDDIRYGLAMLHAECDQRALLGQEDPWRWYRQAWTPRVLSTACDIPDEAAARNRVSPRSGKRTTMTWMDEAKAEIRAKERARATS